MNVFWKDDNGVKKKINKKKIAILSIVLMLIIAIITISIIYIKNKNARNWIDKYIFRKEITQNRLPTIELEESNNRVCAFNNKYIGVLNKNNFDIFDGTGKKESSLTVEITKPIFSSNGRHLVIAEEKGQKLYLITDKEIGWNKSVEGNIAQVTVNKNGYVAVTIVDTSYKTVVEMYDNQGQLLFKTFLSTTRVVATSISEDNKYLALAEIDTSGTMIQSNIKIFSIEDAKTKAENSIKKIYTGQNNDLIINIKYQEKGKLVCLYTDKTTVIRSDETVETISDNIDKKIAFASIELSNATVTVEEKSSGLFTADSIVNIINTDNKSKFTYTTEAVTKEIYTNNNVIALNLGSEVEFINTNGWLNKKYIAEQEITNIVMSNSIAGIVYRDKIEIINL